MTNTTKLFSFILISILVLTGCTGAQISRNYQLKSQEGAILMGIKGPNAGYSLAFQRYDPESNRRVRAFAVAGSFGASSIDRPNQMNYFIGAEEAGSFFLSQLSIFGYYTKYVYVLANHAYTFDVDPGEVVYIGEYEVSEQGTVSFVGFDEARAKEYLSKYPLVKGSFRVVKPVIKSILSWKKADED